MGTKNKDSAESEQAAEASAAAAEPNAAGARGPCRLGFRRAAAHGHAKQSERGPQEAAAGGERHHHGKSRDETIAARDAQIVGLQSELDDLRKQLPEAKLKAAELEADLNISWGNISWGK